MHGGLSRGLGLVRWDLVVVDSMHEQASEPGLVEKSASAGIRPTPIHQKFKLKTQSPSSPLCSGLSFLTPTTRRGVTLLAKCHFKLHGALNEKPSVLRSQAVSTERGACAEGPCPSLSLPWVAVRGFRAVAGLSCPCRPEICEV